MFSYILSAQINWCGMNQVKFKGVQVGVTFKIQYMLICVKASQSVNWGDVK